MQTTLDESGRILLPESLRRQLGLKPGDAVLLEKQGGQWIIKGRSERHGLAWEGDVLVHRGHSPAAIEETLTKVRDDRISHVGKGVAP